MANGDFTNGEINRPLHGHGRWFITNKVLAEKILKMMLPGVSFNNDGSLSHVNDWIKIINIIQNSGSNVSAWLENLNSVLMGSMNYVVIAYLEFS